MSRKLLFCALLFLACVVAAFAEENTVKNQPNQVIVYYFHGDFRCSNCVKFEEYSKETVEINFKEQLTSGELVYKVINTDEKVNAHFVDDYKLYTKSLVLSLVKEGKEVKYKNLEKIWNYVRSKDQYMKYVKDEISAFLGEIK